MTTEMDPYEGYTAADDARDRAAAHLAPNPAWSESASLQRKTEGLPPDTELLDEPTQIHQATIFAEYRRAGPVSNNIPQELP